jgi:hypothetical protein
MLMMLILLCLFFSDSFLLGLYEPNPLKPLYPYKRPKTRVMPKNAISLKTPISSKTAFLPVGGFIYSMSKIESSTTKLIHILITSISSYLIYPIRGGPIEGYSKQA